MGGGGGGRGGGGGQPAFSGRGGGGGGFHSLRASGAPDAAGGGRGRRRGRGGHGGGGGGRGDGSGRNNGNFFGNRDEGEQAADKAEDNPELEAAMGFPLFNDGPPEGKLGWLLNVNATLVDDRDAGRAVAAVNCYFQCQDGSGFKAQVPFAPYFYVVTRPGAEGNVEGYLRRKHGAAVRDVSAVSMEDLDLKNHLAGIRRRLLKVTFWTTQGLGEVRRDLLPAARKAKARDAREGVDSGGVGVGGPSLFGGGSSAAGGNAGGAQDDDCADIEDDDDDDGGPSTSARGFGGYSRGGGRGGAGSGRPDARARVADALSSVLNVREHDVPYATRFLIDTGARCGHWFRVRARGGVTTMERRADLIARADVRVCAFDIETTKLPLQFPNAEFDQIFMISYMVDGQGYLITNREVVSADCADFEYSPKPEFQGPFTVFNERDEAALLRKFFSHVRELKPAVFVTYNGDWFDFPFIANRARFHGLSIEEEIGFKPPAAKVDFGGGFGGNDAEPAAVASMDPSSPLYGPGEWLSRTAVHLDCLHWVNRDSYLPQGSRGLKAVTKAKLGYDPVEVDPENMVPLARSDPTAMAAYSVSDAVSTFYLYLTYVHPFIFSLATIIPLNPDDVLRKGSGTLCEALLMVEAYLAGVLAPNKHVARQEKTFRGKPLESETYIGGKVEALESGVFRSDLPTRFSCDPAAYQALIDSVDEDLGYALRTEFDGTTPEDLEDYDSVRDAVVDALAALRDKPAREERPLIYHLDVAAMYPNIILTNRLQPSAIVTDEDCAACDFNRPGKTCLRPMEWVWRGETYAATTAEYRALKAQLEAETFSVSAANGQIVSGGTSGGNRGFGANSSRASAATNGPARAFYQLAPEERARLLKDRLKAYCSRVYKRVLDKPVAETRVAGVCQRENDFYVGTVRAFRDRRYEYKALNKKWKGKLDAARDAGDALAAQEAADMVVLYDSLQLAHKCILNSFYGYVMRKGARWYSMEMAGVVTATGAAIIDRAAKLVRGIGAPLELDTDGIWCCLPASFPEDLTFSRKGDGGGKGGKKVKVSYPCAVLNVMVARNNTNEQYQDLVDDVEATVAGGEGGEGGEGAAKGDGGGGGAPAAPRRRRYATSSQMSIEFEVDGPYRAMILPASKEEGRLIKKRYAVFNFDGSLAELKGFELKRRGELKLIKVFQAEVFSKFLEGDSLAGCYASVAAVADRWLDLLDSRGAGVDDDELMSYISESCTMSKALDEYDGRKSLPATTARRLAEFLGDARIKDKGLNATYVVSSRPLGAPTSERAIPVAIFAAEPAVSRAFLRKWCGGGDLDDGRGPSERPDVRAVVDWAYYKERLASTVQKIVTIPAAMQRVPNPVPRVRHPEWLHRRVREKEDRLQQRRLDGFLVVGGRKGGGDIEDFGSARGGSAGGAWPSSARKGDGGLPAPSPRAALPAPPPPAAPAAPPSPPQLVLERAADPAAWVVSQKRRWRAAVAARKRRRADASARLAAAARASGGDAHAVERLARLDAAAAAAGDGDAMAGGGAAGNGARSAGGVGALLARAGGGWDALAAGAHLQLLSLEGVAGAPPGELRAWALVYDSGNSTSSAALHSFSLRVPRTFFFASTAQAGSAELAAFSAVAGGGAVVAPARREVPFGKLPPGASLYSVTLPFSSSNKKKRNPSENQKRGRRGEGGMECSSEEEGEGEETNSDDDDDDDEEEALDAALAAPHVVGVWERSLSPAASAALSLGCCASLSPRVRAAKRSLAEGLELGDLVMRTTAECDFLESAADAAASVAATASSSVSFGGLRPIPVYARFDASRGRAVLAAHCPAADKAIIVVVTGAAAASGRGSAPREVTASVAERAWREVSAASPPPSAAPDGDAPRSRSASPAPDQLQQGQQQQASSSFSSSSAPPAFEVAFAPDAKGGLRALQRALSDWRASHRGPAVALVSCRGAGDSPSPSVASFVGGGDELARRLPALRSMPRVDAALSSASTAAFAAADPSTAAAGSAGDDGDAAVAVAAAAAAGDDPGEAALAGALVWQVPAAREAVAALCGARAWLRGASAAARYAHLPLSALGGGGDWRSAAADALLARTARDAGVLLWGSPLSQGCGGSGQALLAGARDGSGGVGVGGVIGGGGGSGEEGGGGGGGGSSLGGDASWLNASSSASAANASSFSAGPPSIDILRPGAYRCACVQLRLHHLLVAAVDAAPALADLDGGALDGGSGGGAAMRCLRRLVRAWVVDATARGSKPADALLLSLGRWLRDDRRGGMYAVPLGEGSLKLAGRLLAALLDALARLGAVAVAADEGSLILAAAGGGSSSATGGGRRGLGSALAAVDYALAALRRRSDGAALFGLLQLTPARWWHALLFRDRYNYLGLRATLPEAVEATLATPGALTQGGDPVNDGGDGGPPSSMAAAEAVASAAAAAEASALAAPDVDCLWTIRDYLPPAVQQAFASAIAEYLWLPWKATAEGSKASSSLSSQAVAAACAAGGEAAQVAWLKANLDGALGRRLLRVVADADAALGAHDGDAAHAFPELVGSHLTSEELGSPALALTRAVCEAMSLDLRLSGEVSALRRNMLRLARTREFSGAAAFRDPCATFVLRGVVCGGCGAAADLDLCRDPALTRGSSGCWRCGACGARADAAAVEARLLDAVGAAAAAYATQDLRCVRCRGVACGHLTRACDQCGGGLELTKPPSSVTTALRTLRRVARFHGFELLDEAASWLLQEG